MKRDDGIEMGKLQNLGMDEIWFWGSRFHRMRAIRTDGERFYVVWGGVLIEVERRGSWRTVESY